MLWAFGQAIMGVLFDALYACKHIGQLKSYDYKICLREFLKIGWDCLSGEEGSISIELLLYKIIMDVIKE